MKKKLTSRKLLIAIFAIILLVANKVFDLGFDKDTTMGVVLAAATYILGESFVDGTKK